LGFVLSAVMTWVVAMRLGLLTRKGDTGAAL